MNNRLLTIFVFPTFLLSIHPVYAGNISISELSGKETTCTAANVSDIIYFSESSQQFAFMNEMSASRDVVISSQSEVQYWLSDSNILSSNCKAIDGNDWKIPSGTVPADTNVSVIVANCTLYKPKNKNSRDLQVVYKIKYADVSKNGTEPVTFNYWTNNGGSWINNTKTYNNFSIDMDSRKNNGNDCFNLELQYCGDGLISASHGETCDPEDSSQAGWGNGGCSNTCQPNF